MKPRPSDEEDLAKFEDDKQKFLEIVKKKEVDLIVVCADSLEARRLKKNLTDWII
jgi:Icc-related predicted phosphoesterase